MTGRPASRPFGVRPRSSMTLGRSPGYMASMNAYPGKVESCLCMDSTVLGRARSRVGVSPSSQKCPSHGLWSWGCLWTARPKPGARLARN